MILGEDLPTGSPENSNLLEGTIIRSTGSWYDVQVIDRVIPSKIRGKFRLNEDDVTNPVAVGDRVTIRTASDETGLIVEIHERKNRLTRRAAGRRVGQEHVIAANIDCAWIVQSIRSPKINQGLIDRFLVMTESFDIPPSIVFNKVDLMQKNDRDAVYFMKDLYEDIGYTVLVTSALTGEGIPELRERMMNRINVFSGPSGVGKSALLNQVEPALNVPVGIVSERTQKGKHTTTWTTTYPLSQGGFVIDTPGIREFGIIDLAPEELSYYFLEFRLYLPECAFPNCTHDHEPDCAVKTAVEDGAVTEERYDSYLNILDSVRMGARDVGR